MKFLLKPNRFYVCGGRLKNVKINSFSMPYSLASETFSYKSLQCEKNQVHVLGGTSNTGDSDAVPFRDAMRRKYSLKIVTALHLV